MMYTKEGWKPVTTELNDPVQQALHHEDWCEDMTCYCHREYNRERR